MDPSVNSSMNEEQAKIHILAEVKARQNIQHNKRDYFLPYNRHVYHTGLRYKRLQTVLPKNNIKEIRDCCRL